MIYESFAHTFETREKLDNYVYALERENIIREQQIKLDHKIEKLRSLKAKGLKNKAIYSILGVRSYIEYFKIYP
jgi:hypothetical protein